MLPCTREQLFQRLAERLMPESHVVWIRPLSGGMSAQLTAFALKTADNQQQSLVQRTYAQPNPALISREFRLLQLGKAAGLAVPTAHYLDLSGEIFADPYLVLEYVDGQMLLAPTELASYLRQLAEHLAQIHGADYSQHDLSFLPVSLPQCAELKRPILPTPFAAQESHIRQALAAAGPPRQANPATLLHGDFWPGNSLWQAGKLVAIIDWEDAAWGDALIDLARSRSEIVWIFGRAAMQSFTSHYQAVARLDAGNLPYWDLCAALRFLRLFGSDLAEAAAYFVQFGRDDLTAKTIIEDMAYFIDQALELLLTDK